MRRDHRVHRLSPALPLLAAAVLAAPLLTGCSSDGAKGCASVAQEVNGQVRALRSAAGSSGSDPRAAATALRKIQQDLDDIDSQDTNGAAASKAIGDLSLAVSDAKNQLDTHQSADAGPVVRAAGELTTACPTKG